MERSLRTSKGAFVFGRDAIRELDRAAIEEFGVPGAALMENASTALRDACLAKLPVSDAFVLIVAGPGNNGGDGLALARRLHNERVRTATVLTAAPDRYRGDAAVNLHIVEKMALPLSILNRDDPQETLDLAAGTHSAGPDLIVDALFGTGLDRPVRDPAPAVVAWINARRREDTAVLAVDIPSGLDCDTGRPLGEGADAAVRADITVTLAGLKKGFAAPEAAEWLGEVLVGDIGAPLELMERFAEGRV